LNALLSACLLQEKEESILLNVLLEKSSLIYNLIKANSEIQTYMLISPQ